MDEDISVAPPSPGYIDVSGDSRPVIAMPETAPAIMGGSWSFELLGLWAPFFLRWVLIPADLRVHIAHRHVPQQEGQRHSS